MLIIKDFVITVVMTLFLLTAPGCGERRTVGEPPLVRVNDATLSRAEFQRSFDIAMTAAAYPPGFDLQAARVAHLRELVERMILAERARELGIRVSEAELDRAEAALKRGYPDGDFSSALLESAISPADFRTELEARLLMDKVVAADLALTVTVSPEEVAERYRARYDGSGDPSEVFYRTIVRQLRREKLEAAYRPWITALRHQYEVAINRTTWNTIADAP